MERVPGPAKVKTYKPIPSIDPTRSVWGISGVWTPEPIQASMNFERTCAGRRDFRVGPGEQYCEHCRRSPRLFRTWQSQRVMADRFGCAKRGSRTRSGSVNGTKGVDSQKAVPATHKDTFPDLFASQSVTTLFPASPCPIGEIGGGRERPPFLLPGAGAGALRNSHLHNTPWGGRSRPKYPLREGQ